MLVKVLAKLVITWLPTICNALADDNAQWRYKKVNTHPCNRVCIEGQTMNCYYKFKVEKYFAMSKACYDCPHNLEDCYREDCVHVDGHERPILTVNRKIPGPTIEVCLGDKIVVDVENMMPDESTSIHWHGHHQLRSPYMDGVPYVTQCPIHPMSTFRYTFHGDNAGTLFWHAHTGVQRAEGLFSALVVRVPDSKNFHRKLYDLDLSEHIMVVNDWTHQSSIEKYLSHVQALGTNKADVFLVNGQGRHYNDTKRVTNTPVAVFKVTKGLRYRFRVVNSGIMNCPLELYIDKHNVTYISSDGYDFNPIHADSMVSYAGERWDFVLNATQEVGNYWIRFKGLMDCDQRFTSAHQVAVLHYEGAPEVEPKEQVGYSLYPPYTRQINSLNVPIDEPNTVSMPQLLASDKNRDHELLRKKPDDKIFLGFDFSTINHPFYHKRGAYGFYQVDSKYRMHTPQFNHITFKWPHSPLLSQYNNISKDFFCSSHNLTNCKTELCECTNIIHIPLNRIVELILIDEGKELTANHPFHLHGYAFRVIGMDKLGSETRLETVKSLDKMGKLVRNLQNPPSKDTVTVPVGGYTILRFRADNPGFWLMHCHIEYHLEEGMAVVFEIGEHEDLPPSPKDFPKCGDFLSDGTP